MKKRGKLSDHLIAIIVCLIMCLTQCVTVLAADTTITGVKVNLNSKELTVSESKQTVTATIDLTLDGGNTIAARGANYKLSLPENWTLDSYTLPEAAAIKSASATAGMWALMSGSTDINSLATLVIGIPAGTVAGTYEISVSSVKVSDASNTTLFENGTASVQLEIKAEEIPATNGYSVVLSSDAPSACVAKGSSFNVNLDVTNANATTFNAFYSVLTYDSTKVSYTGEGTVGDYTVDKSESGKLIVSRVGSDVTIGETPELTLPFKADAAGNADFTLTKANVDVKEHAEAQDAPEAAISGSPMSVTVLETYTVTFTGGTGATGTDPTQAATVAGGTIELPANPYTYSGHTFAGWNDGTTTYEAGKTYTMPSQNVTFTAQWTENPVEPVVENVNGTTDDKQPDYVGTNEAASNELVVAKISGPEGYVPTYAGNPMFKVEGYDDNYYYVIPDGTYDNEKLGYVEGTVKTIAKSSDVNQTNLVDINDAQFVYNIYNDKATPTANVVERLILADTNRDKIVDTNDCAMVVGDIQ